MSNSQQSFSTQALKPLDKCITPDNVQLLSFLSPDQKVQYHKGITGLWEKVHGQDQGERQAAHKRLSEVTQNLQVQMMKWKQENPSQAQGQQQQQQQQMQQQQQQQQQLQQRTAAAQAQQQSQAQPQGLQQNNPGNQAGQQQQNQQVQFSDRVKQLARELKVQVPQNLQASSAEDQQRYVVQERRKYAQALQRYEQAQHKFDVFKAKAAERNKQQQFTQEETEKVRNNLTALQQSAAEARKQSLLIKQQHEGSMPNSESQQLAQGQQQQPGQQPPQQQAQIQQVKQENAQKPQVPKPEPEVKTEPPAAQGTAAYSQPQSQPQSQSQIQAPAPTQTSQTQVQTPTQVQAQGSQPNIPKPPTPSTAAHPQPGTMGTVTGATGVQPLSHDDALRRAAQFSQTTQQPPHGHPPQGSQPQPIQRDGGSTQATTSSNRHQQRPLNVQPPQPVSLAPARPTLTGGPGTMSQMGQPGIQKPPAFSLEGDTDRVLSKKKLDDLVRQVTGGSGGEGAESLDPDVEETLLDVADEFVDNVITQACRLAKLRQSAQLELRDIQLILERNYNIRVPGFASDELRTVKKIQPTQAWTQKMSAVQAAKVTGGKADI